MALTNGFGGVLGAVALLALGAAGCGDNFNGSDCKVSHTCVTAGGGAADADTSPHAGEKGEDASPDTAPGVGGAHDGVDSAPAGGAGEGLGGTPADAGQGGANVGGFSQADAGAGGATVAVNRPPTVTKVSPSASASNAEPDAKVVITFSEPLDPATITADSVRLLDGKSVVAGKLSYENNQVTFIPKAPLALLVEYEVAVSTTVTDAAGAALAADYASTFRVRDGAWHTIDAASGDLYQMSDTVPITSTGDALVTWIAITDSGHYCPTSARWFNRGTAKGSTALLTGNDVQDCRSVAAGANAAGAALVAWQEDVEFATQYRAGKWTTSKTQVTPIGTSRMFAVGVAPSGAATLIQHHWSFGTVVATTDSKGTWEERVADISVGGESRGLSPARIAFDKKGNGFAAWRGEDMTGHEQISISHYTTATGLWPIAKVLPGSLASETTADDERSAPALAVDAAGHAMVLWVRETAGVTALVASRNTGGDMWSDPVVIKPSGLAGPITDAPALVFDGQTFVAAWVARDGGTTLVYTSRFDQELLQWNTAEPRTAKSALGRMPKLGSDAHQNLVLTWVVSQANGGALAYSRYDAQNDSWTDPSGVDGGSITDATIAGDSPTPLSVNSSGLGALMWSDRAANGLPVTIRLASFY